METKMNYASDYNKAIKYSKENHSELISHIHSHPENSAVFADLLEEGGHHSDDETLNVMRSPHSNGLVVSLDKQNKIKVREKPTHVEIHGKRWFQRTYGNTYHSSDVHLTYPNGEIKIIKTPIEYGYGSHYLWTAHDFLKREGLIPNDTLDYNPRGADGPTSHSERHGINLQHDVEDVRRKADLK